MRLYTQIAIGTLLTTVAFSVMADELSKFAAKLTGFKETPSILSGGSGTFKSRLDKGGTVLSYTLTFSGLSSDATTAHIHFGQAGVAGGPIAFLCGGGSKPACPSNGGTVTGTIVASDVLAIPSQGINGGSFSDFLIALRSGHTYVNVHSMTYRAGEVRGQIKRS